MPLNGPSLAADDEPSERSNPLLDNILDSYGLWATLCDEWKIPSRTLFSKAHLGKEAVYPSGQ